MRMILAGVIVFAAVSIAVSPPGDRKSINRTRNQRPSRI
jgi:hypothetical protein